MKKINSFLLALGVATSSALAANVEKIEIISVDKVAISEALVYSRMTLQVGAVFTPEALSNDIKSLVNSGHFATVDCEVVPSGDNVILKVSLSNQPNVRRVTFSGNVEFEEKDLRKALKLDTGSKFEIKLLAEDKKALQKLYDDKHYYGTEVSVDFNDVGEKNVDIVWTIAEQPRYKVGEINFINAEAFKAKELRGEITTSKSILSYILPYGYFNEFSLLEDRNQLGKFYNKAGYLDFKVQEIKKIPNENRIDLDYVFEEGKRYKIKSVRLEGNKVYSTDDLLNKRQLRDQRVDFVNPVKLDEYYNGAAGDFLIEKIKNDYYSQGYADAQVNSSFVKSQVGEEAFAEMVITVVEGKPSTVRDINITGNRATKDYVIRRELNILPGEKLDKRKVDAAKRRLANLNYFESYDVMPATTEHEDQRDINISVTEKRTGQFMIGAGFSTEDSVIGSIEISQSNFDISNPPRYVGGGQKMRMRLQAGTTNNEFLLAFTEPWLFNRHLSLNTSAYLKEREYDDYDQDTIGMSLSIGRQIEGYEMWRSTTGVTIEEIKIGNFEDNATAQLRANDGRYFTPRLFQTWTRDSTDAFRFPTSGSKFDATFEFQSEAFGAYTNAYKANISFDKYFKLDREYNWTLRLGGRIAQTNKLSGDELGIFDRFFAGGPGTVRGFKYRDISPVDANEVPLGGESMLTATAELMIPITDQVRFILFSDAGNVWEDRWDYKPSDVNVSVGFGFRIILPIAPISIDYGIPVLTQEDHLGKSGRVHFNLGFSY